MEWENLHRYSFWYVLSRKRRKNIEIFPIFRCSGLNYRVLKSCKKGHGTVSLWIFRSRGSGRLWHLQVQLQGHKSSQQLCHAPVLEPSRQGDSFQALNMFSWIILQLCPLWVAPNLLTLVGFICCIGHWGLLAITDYDFRWFFDNDPISCSSLLQRSGTAPPEVSGTSAPAGVPVPGVIWVGFCSDQYSTFEMGEFYIG